MMIGEEVEDQEMVCKCLWILLLFLQLASSIYGDRPLHLQKYFFALIIFVICISFFNTKKYLLYYVIFVMYSLYSYYFFIISLI